MFFLRLGFTVQLTSITSIFTCEWDWLCFTTARREAPEETDAGFLSTPPDFLGELASSPSSPGGPPTVAPFPGVGAVSDFMIEIRGGGR